ncbi:putative diphthamide synthesis protein-domain-containing protein [Russula aff. rugulosa BPL654]|nr:putative diphthamide synthesis protein-domain-containing protein [Russula aff. rugulosa BPL654]
MTESVFSSSAQAIIQKPLALESDETSAQLSAEQFNDYYELEWTANEINSKNYMRVALQYPDELLRDSVPIYQNLKRAVGATRELYVLADTSYGSCCVDEVSAQHVDADAVVHYGHACMSKTYRLPVIYVFGKKPIDVADAAQKLFDSFASSSVSAKSVVLRHDVAYTHEAENLVAALRGVFVHRDISVSYNPIPRTLSPSTPLTTSQNPVVNSEGNVVDANFLQVSSEDVTPILYVGASTRALTNLLLTHPTTPVHGYDPTTRQATLQSAKTNKLLMRRYAVVQKARDADVFGILVGTLGVASYLPLISYLRQVLTNAHKKAYTISVGKLNPAKLANFAEIECFVLVACPENSPIDAKDFFRPIVTPFELQLALQPSPTWTGEYVLDFDEVLTRGASKPSSDQDEEGDPDRPMFSLLTGRYRHAKRYGEDDRVTAPPPSSSAVVLRDQDSTIATLKDTAAGEFLQSRTFRGLETRTGLDPPSVLQQGRSGIARGYDDDHLA